MERAGVTCQGAVRHDQAVTNNPGRGARPDQFPSSDPSERGPISAGADPATAPAPGGPGDTDSVRLTAWVHGRVQGVGFRWWTRARALELGLVGRAVNRPDGRVEVVAEGRRSDCERLLALLRGPGTPGRVTVVVERFDLARGDLAGFQEG